MNQESLQATVQEALEWRYATKRFDPTQIIPHATWETLERSLHLAPSSFGLQPWHFIVVKNPALRKELQGHSWNQPQVTDASHFVVLTALRGVDESYIDAFLSTTAATRSIPVESLAGYRGMIVPFVSNLRDSHQLEAWTTRQVYLALGMLLTTAAVLGIDACPLEGIDPTQYDRILGLEQKGVSTKVACALGYRASSDPLASMPKVRFPHDKIFTYRS
jgi:nitroreductase